MTFEKSWENSTFYAAFTFHLSFLTKYGFYDHNIFFFIFNMGAVSLFLHVMYICQSFKWFFVFILVIIKE